MRTPSRPTVPLALLLVALIALATGCADTDGGRPATPLAPRSAPSFEVAGAVCDAGVATQIRSDLDVLFTTRATRDSARKQFADVRQNCTRDRALAQSQMFALVDYSTRHADPKPNTQADTTTAAARTSLATLARFWNNLFIYVAYDSPGVSVSTVSLYGGTRVVLDPATSVDIITGDGNAILRVPANAVTGNQLYTLTPIAVNCLPTNLAQRERCYDVAAHPALDATASDQYVVGICQPSSGGHPPEKLSIGHEKVSGETEVLPKTSVAGISGFCGPEEHAAIAPRPGAGPIERLWHGATQLAAHVGRTVGPRPAYAAHTGVGGVTRLGSPYGTIDRDVFRATFDANVLGALTTSTPAEKGMWTTAAFDPPGSLTIVAPFGALTTRHAQLNQGGGACNACGTLQLTGQVATAKVAYTANSGVYETTFELVQDKPTVKAAPFHLLDASRRPIATLSYRTLSSARQVLYNGVPVTTWAVGQRLRFRIMVDFATDRTSLQVETTTPGLFTTLVASAAFVNTAADEVKFIEANFSGIDAGIFRWDGIRIQRLDNGAAVP